MNSEPEHQIANSASRETSRSDTDTNRTESVIAQVSATQAQLSAGEVRIGRHQVQRVLGTGGFGQVYLAYDPELGRQVAIKVPRLPESMTREEVVGFREEARTVAGLDHPGIVPVYDVGADEGIQCFIVSKYIDGTDLQTRQKASPYGPWEAARLVASVAEALHYAHREGFVHRDLKPSNILLDDDGVAYVADFGLAVHEASQREHKGERAGTAGYMAPEQVRGESHLLDGRTDIWSLGIMLYELLAGRRPFQGTSREIYDAILSTSPPPMSEADRLAPPELERICLKCLSKDVTQRYTTAADLAADLRKAVEAGERRERTAMARPALGAIWPILLTLAAATAAVVLSVGAWQAVSRIRNEIRQLGLAIETNQELLRRESNSPQPTSPFANMPESARAPLDENGQPLSSQETAEMHNREIVVRFDQSTPEFASQSSFENVTPPVVARLTSHSGPVRASAFSPDSAMLATAGDDQTVKLWNTSDWSLSGVFRGYGRPIHCVAFSPDNRRLAFGGDGVIGLNVRVLDLETHEQLASFSWVNDWGNGRVTGMAFSPDGSLLATACNGPGRIWDLKGKALLHELTWQEFGPSTAFDVSFSSDGKTLALGCRGGKRAGDDTVSVWNVSDGELVHLLTGDIRVNREDILSKVLMMSDPQRVARVGYDNQKSGSVRIWQDGVPEKIAIAPGDAFSALLTTDQKLLAVSVRNSPNNVRAFGGGFDDGFGGVGDGGFGHRELGDAPSGGAEGDDARQPNCAITLQNVFEKSRREFQIPASGAAAAVSQSANQKWIAIGTTRNSVWIVDSASSTETP